jgi:apolipoprotein N-acyltransferase
VTPSLFDGAFSPSDSTATQLRPLLLAVGAGLLLALSFPLPGLSFLAWAALVPLLMAIREQAPRLAFRTGFVAGLTAYLGIFYWLNIVMTRYGKLPLAASLVLTLVMAAYLALYVAACAGLTRRAELAGVPVAASLPILWVAGEFLRAYLLTGFPWASLGYTQYRVLPLIQVADLTGVYGVSFLIVYANVILYRVLRALRRGSGARYPTVTALILVVLLAGCIGYGFVQLNRPESGSVVRVALAQGNIPQDVKWDPAFQEQTVAIYERLSRQAAGSGRELVVWPESSLPFYFQEESVLAARVSGLARELDSALVVSSPAVESRNGRPVYLNSGYLIAPDGTTAGRSDKIHLVPFGEYVPLGRLLPFVHKLAHGIGDFSPGEAAVPLAAPFGRFGLLICFEGIFPEISRAYVAGGARLLVNITNDAWFGRSSAPYQHLAMTVFRAVENRVPLVRSANTGISAVIDSRGHIRGMTGLFHEALLTGEVRLGTTASPYTRSGDLFAGLCLLSALLLGGLYPWYRSRRLPAS